MSLPGVDHESALFAWVFAQFLWQGCLPGTVGVVAEARWFHASHQTRYRILELCSITLWSLPLLLLLGALRQLHMELQVGLTGALKSPHTVVPLHPWIVVLMAHGYFFVVIWLVGAALLLVRLAAGWFKLHSLSLQPATESLAELLNREISRAGITEDIEVCTANLSAPLVFGALRPRLIMPNHLRAALHEDEIRALLHHELAHIRRKDYLRNLVQRVMACVFWFHPVSWLLLHRLATRRELCCDAEAARSCAPAALGRALVKLLESAATQPLMGLAQSSLSGEMETRLLALLDEDPLQESTVSGKAFSVGLSATLPAMLVALFAVAVLRPAQTGLLRLAQDPLMLVRAQDDAGPFELRVRGGRVFGAQLGDEVLPATSIAQRGTVVSLLDKGGRPILVLTVEPSGRVQWRSRPRL
jgi:beta-lactamase regulating signal transducer with metallopeptidase domain